ncbi:helix-turn-helix transcriptional regulator [Streptococcus equi]|uniref:Putative DNA binding phage protein n=1 Tax=Streptococcus equi subsp. equi (strain 4047) TaxID=553482 RepID=C0MBA7_STRE4|nr:hypothetical protein [Streptococcus equi]QBX15244.1 hypothetical protein Javan179_0006 [Streptococcus phage Javan179]HEL0689983.1 hypothetical protein [Streptococcus equi subsp. zooepidemicus]MBT1195040.1 hypothetical protein [Streptococcus equi subsp. equi]MBT1200271.1 hypothetical protein [Streptococcus equi subsp. equi]MBT1203256.1 hypothetical protein [Streptococcus equi subsp. equi]
MDNILMSLSDWIKEIIEKTVNRLVQIKLDEANAELLTREKVADRLNMSPATFDKYYRYDKNFPSELPGVRWKKAEIIAWLNNK